MSNSFLVGADLKTLRLEGFIQRFLWLFALLALICSLGLQHTFFGPGLTTKLEPSFGLPGLAMLFLSFLGGLAVALVVTRRVVHVSDMLDTPLRVRMPLGIALTIALLLGAAVGLVLFPRQLPFYIMESEFLSFAQEFALFLAVLLLGATAMLPGKAAGFRFVCGAMCATVLFIFLEEISYGQHYFGWETGAFFATNQQNETNLHNFYTHTFETFYYIGAVVCLIWLPIIMTFFRVPLLAWARPYVPHAWFVIVAFPISAHLYMDWHMAVQQFGFFASAMVLVLFLLKMQFHRRSELFLLAGWTIFVATLCVQCLYFIQGHLLWNQYESAEIKETHISLALLLYGLWLHNRHRDA